jgi:heptosyltransferase-1
MSERRVLIVRVGAMGDVLHALPAVAALRRERPRWRVDWVVDPRWAPLLADIDGERRGIVVDKVHLAETKMWSGAPFSLETMRSVGALRRALRGELYDLVVDMQGTLRSAVIGRFAKAEEFVSYADPREAAAARLYKRTIARRGAHVVEQGAALLGEACGLSLEPVGFELPREQWAEEWAAELVGERRVCLLAASAGWGAKQWPAERFGALAKELKEMGFAPMVNAPRKDEAIAARVVEASGGAAERVVCNVTGLIALMRRTALLVGGDSGPTHLAAALGVPLVALYGPTDPARNGPWGDGTKRVLRDASSVTSHKKVGEVEKGLARIGVDAVVEAVRELVSSHSLQGGGFERMG